MANDYYPEPDDQSSAMETESEVQDESGGKTALLPKSILCGKECSVGDTVTLKVTHIYEDELAVEPQGNGEEDESESLKGDEEFDMMEKGGGNA